MQSPILLVADDITDLEESIVKDSDGKFRCPLPDCLKPCSTRGSTTRATSRGTKSGVLVTYHRVSGVECRMEDDGLSWTSETEATSDLTALKLEDWLSLFAGLPSPVSSDTCIADFHPTAMSEAVNAPELDMDVLFSDLDLPLFNLKSEDLDSPISTDVTVSQMKIEVVQGLDLAIDNRPLPFLWEGLDHAPMQDYSFSQLLRDFMTPDDEM
ncbi:hypothetical protein HDU93_006516 [Gonapodya sp. JEL0774]|nr:hypothetical protein HDU93_006516 [Gonapodya sp. JEL0774]